MRGRGRGWTGMLAGALALVVPCASHAAGGVSAASASAAGGTAAAVAGVRDAAQVAQLARGLKAGQVLRLEGIELEGEAAAKGAELEVFEVTTDQTEIVVEEHGGSRRVRPEKAVYLRGAIDGAPGSVAVFSVHEDDEIRGIVTSNGDTWTMQAGAASAGSVAGAGGRGLRSRKVDPAAKSRKFECDSAEEHQAVDGMDALADQMAGGASGEQIAALPLQYTAQIAVELDYEFFLQHGSSITNAVRYATDLVAFTSSISLSELGMNLKIPFIRVWSVENDPYSGLSSSERLNQLRAWWNSTNSTHCGDRACTSIKRATTLYLSSARTGGGVAYINALCDAYRSPGNSYGYAFVGNITGSFSISDPRVVWDIVGTSHELGHNFGSQHTHCYQPAVDQCAASSSSGCYNGPSSLPSGCPGGGSGCGTIMSYCHLLSGGMGNLSLTFGLGHPYGTLPQRVPSAMLNHIASEYAQTPSCFAVETTTPTPTPPNAPSDVEAFALSSSQIRVTWVDRSSDETGFKISRRTDIDKTWKDVATVGAGTTGFTNSGLTAGTVYYYRVRAYNSQGESLNSIIASAATPGATLPKAPSNLVAAPMSSTSALLAWSDNSSNETGFEIRRKTGDGRYKKIATVGANSESFQDNNLSPRTRYSYRVRAFNQLGRSKISNSVTITTP